MMFRDQRSDNKPEMCINILDFEKASVSIVSALFIFHIRVILGFILVSLHTGAATSTNLQTMNDTIVTSWKLLQVLFTHGKFMVPGESS